jgi:hypothetical protein
MDATYAIVMLWVLVVAGFAIWRRIRLRTQGPAGPSRRQVRPLRRYDDRLAWDEPTGRQGQKQYIRGLTLSDREQYIEIWRMNQARYPDDPRSAVLEADQLISTMMRRRGYRLSDLDRPPHDPPPAHHRVVGNYRMASEIVGRYRRGQAGAEDLCKAMVCYRALFDQLLEVAAART